LTGSPRWTRSVIQLGVEYHPEPPYRAGSPDIAPPAIVEAMRGMASEVMS
jgi:hypothetical protein